MPVIVILRSLVYLTLNIITILLICFCKMPARIPIHNRFIMTISIQIQTKRKLNPSPIAILTDEASNTRVIIPRVQEIIARLLIVNVTVVTEWRSNEVDNRRVAKFIIVCLFGDYAKGVVLELSCALPKLANLCVASLKYLFRMAVIALFAMETQNPADLWHNCSETYFAEKARCGSELFLVKV